MGWHKWMCDLCDDFDTPWQTYDNACRDLDWITEHWESADAVAHQWKHGEAIGESLSKEKDLHLKRLDEK